MKHLKEILKLDQVDILSSAFPRWIVWIFTGQSLTNIPLDIQSLSPNSSTFFRYKSLIYDHYDIHVHIHTYTHTYIHTVVRWIFVWEHFVAKNIHVKNFLWFARTHENILPQNIIYHPLNKSRGLRKSATQLIAVTVNGRYKSYDR